MINQRGIALIYALMALMLVSAMVVILAGTDKLAAQEVVRARLYSQQADLSVSARVWCRYHAQDAPRPAPTIKLETDSLDQSAATIVIERRGDGAGQMWFDITTTAHQARLSSCRHDHFNPAEQAF